MVYSHLKLKEHYMKFTHTALVLSLIAGFALSIQPAAAKPFDKDDFTKEQLASIKVTMADAIAKAQETQHGTPIKVEMENDDNTIVYEIELVNNDKENKVKINAVTGEVISSGKK